MMEIRSNQCLSVYKNDQLLEKTYYLYTDTSQIFVFRQTNKKRTKKEESFNQKTC